MVIKNYYNKGVFSELLYYFTYSLHFVAHFVIISLKVARGQAQPMLACKSIKITKLFIHFVLFKIAQSN